MDISTEVKCSAPEAYGFIRGVPCIALKMNRIFGWEPKPYYNISEVRNSPSLPGEVKKLVEQTYYAENCNKTAEEKCLRLRMVWVTCQGATSADREYLGPFRYMPVQGYPGYFFPFLNQQHYLR